MNELPKPGEKGWPRCRYCGVDVGIYDNNLRCLNKDCKVIMYTCGTNAEAIATLNAPMPTPKMCPRPALGEVYNPNKGYKYYVSGGRVMISGTSIDTGWREEDVR